MIFLNKVLDKVEVKNAQLIISVIVSLSYMAKSIAKLLGGILLGIQTLIVDGIHSFVDILEHFILVFAARYARKEDRLNYPIGKEPLIDLIQAIIYFGLLLLGIKFFLNGIALTLLFLFKLSFFPANIYSFLSQIIAVPPIPKSIFLLYAAAIFLSCYLISEIVYRIEYSIAIKFKLREMIADAMELKSDGWIELSTFIFFVVGWLATRVIFPDVSDVNLEIIINIFLGLTLIYLSSHIIKVAIPELSESVKNIMNRALAQPTRNKLEDYIIHRLPSGCKLLRPIVSFHRGDQLFLLGAIHIDASEAFLSDMIISKANRLAKSYLNNISGELHIHFSTAINPWTPKSIENDLMKVAEVAWGINKNSPLFDAFKFLRKGWPEKALPIVVKHIEQCKYTDNERYFITYIIGECNIMQKGFLCNEASEMTEKACQLLKNEVITNSYIMLLSWLLIIETGRFGKDSEKQDVLIKSRQSIINILNSGRFYPNIVKAECFFALGYNWMMCLDYDLQNARSFFKQAEVHYHKSKSRSEMDRLMNTWGHLETLAYSLGDARDYLDIALEIRENRNDELGLTYTYGSMGGLYSKLGFFLQADGFFLKDIELCKKLNILQHIPKLNLKRGELKITHGLFRNNEDNISIGMGLCKTVRVSDIGSDSEIEFFSMKGEIKGLLGLAVISNDASKKKHYLENAEGLINKLAFAESVYHNSFRYRLKGRFCGLIGDYKEAESCFINAIECFEKLASPGLGVPLNLQTIACKIEKDALAIQKTYDHKKCEESIKELEDFLEDYGGTFGETAELLYDKIDEIKILLKNAPSKYEKFILEIYRLIWFIEG